MKFVLLIIAMAILAYVLGSVNGAIIASKYFFRKDIREYGSGNPGLTNFYRVFGKVGVLLVVAIDVIKTVAPVLVGGWLFGRFFDMALFGRVITGFFVMLGHCFPVFYGFRGGKGVMAAGAILFIVDWRIAIISWGVFALITATTRFVSLGAIIGSAAYPISMLLLQIGGFKEVIAAFLSAVLIIARHQGNVVRLAKGEESRFSFRRNKK